MVVNISDAELDLNPSLKRQIIFELEYDPRLHKKEHDSVVRGYQDFQDWVEAHGVEHKYQRIIINRFLSHVNGLKVHDLQILLRQEYFLSVHDINLIIKHLITNNRFVEIDTKNEYHKRYPDERFYVIYKKPRTKVIEHPHSIWIPHPQRS